MPSGQTHDRITLWSLPFIAGLTFSQTRSSHLTFLVTGSFLFSGLMFGPDLDIDSRQFQRWGMLRCFWVPYQNSLRHRSFLSHGPFIGTALRILYLAGGLGIVGFLGLIVAQYLGLLTREPLEIFQHSLRSLSHYPRESIAVYLGLEMGAMSHSFSDWSNSLYKEFRKWLKTGKTYEDIPETPKPKKTKRQVSESSQIELPAIKPKRQKSNSTTAKKSTRRPKK
ncbi:metal-binding protein [Planktothrix paucivesiculata]|uniref:Metal-binding protein n=1 Tax=Planktothrix paucivesiculata PCC 9631 TaxID=671071 RepID=A0A7Z9BHF0_9CYAN|nr:metal-binding protein [Planktothrix paucivesiculata]VXD13231.1 conserved hypothetical protein [Planktothrix paucivesiculata PCC 9631]